MSRRVRRTAVTAAATLLCAAAATPAHAQRGEGPGANPPLTGEFPGGSSSQSTPTPTPSPTATETATAAPTETPVPTPTATATPEPGKKGGELPNTGSDPLRVGLMGFTLLGFGLSLRLRVSDARRHH